MLSFLRVVLLAYPLASFAAPDVRMTRSPKLRGSGTSAAKLPSASTQEYVDKCTNPCGGGVPDPSKPGKATMKEVGDIVGRSLGLLTALVPVPGADVVGAILGAGTMAFDSYMAPSGSRASAWASAKLQENLQYMEDYLVCEMKEIVGDYFEEYMDKDALDKYNNALAGIQKTYFEKCPIRNCLNFTDRAGDQRNHGYNMCCDTSPDPAGEKQCNEKHASEEKISHGKAFCNTRSGLSTGVCGQDRKCYRCVDADSVIKDVHKSIDQMKESDYVSGGESLNGYQNVDAITAYAKGAGFVLQLYQYLILLGERGSNGVSVEFAKTTRDWLQAKIDAMQSNSSRLKVVDDSSEFYDAAWGDAKSTCSNFDVHYCNHGQVQSLTQAPGYRVRFGCGDGRQHYFVRLASDDQDFCNGCANDELTMSMDASLCEVTFYNDAYYEGHSHTLPGVKEDRWLDNINDKISSFKVLPGCPGLTLYSDVDYGGHKEDYVGDVNWVGDQMNDKASSYRPWLTAELYNKTNGCTCTALQPSAESLIFRPYWGGADEFVPVQMKCARTITDYANEGHETPSDTTRFCNAWSRDSNGFSGYSRQVPSFNSKRLEAAELLRELYNEKLADVYSFINNLTMYIENDGASNWTWGVLKSEYYPQSPECPSKDSVGINR